MHLRSLLVAATAISGLGHHVCAQPASRQDPPSATMPTPSGTKEVEEVVVTAPQPSSPQTSIDRRSYSLATDLQTTSGSVGDALRNIPSVEVDSQGNISLRGDPNVTIMIDGKVSSALGGPGGAAALQQLSANSIERVEVITNPTAAMNPDGSGGIINLITKKGRGARLSGTITANVGDAGRRNLSASATHNSNRLAVNLDGGARWDVQDVRIEDNRAFDDGLTVGNLSSGTIRSVTTNANLSVDYDVTSKTRLSASLRFFDLSAPAQVTDQYAASLANGALMDDFDRIGRVAQDFTDLDFTTSLRQSLDGDGHDLTVMLNADANRNRGNRTFVYLRGPPEPDQNFEHFDNDIDQDHYEVKIDYRRPLGERAKLLAGYQGLIEENNYHDDRFAGTSGASAVFDPRFTNNFDYKQKINAIYATYEGELKSIDVVAGLRLEAVEVETRQTVYRNSNDYVRAYPSLHLSRTLGERTSVKFSYSRRVQRPTPLDVNPFPFQQDAFTLRAGNPDLKPELSDTFEAGWQYRTLDTSYGATAYYRVRHDLISNVLRDLGDGSLLSTRENVGELRNSGVEFSSNVKPSKTLSFGVSGNLYWTDLDVSLSAAGEDRSFFAAGGRATLTWQPSGSDTFQLNGNVNARALRAQGSRRAHHVLNFGYRHRLDDKLSATIKFQDILNSNRTVVVVRDGGLDQRIMRDVGARAVVIGFSRTLGGGKRRNDADFDFSTPSPGS